MKLRYLLLAAFAALMVSTQASVNITKSAGWLETAYAEWAPGSYTNYHAYVRPAGGEYTQLARCCCVIMVRICAWMR